MHFCKLSDLELRQMLPGCNARFIHTDNMTVSYWNLDGGAVIPPHKHPHEQVTSLIEGKLEMSVGGECKTIEPGEIVIIPGDVEHSVNALTPCYVIDAFYPARDDYR
ncbi:cupin domain-containing protein [bacterium]|nr:cupin domain-containing protein [bacterium]